MQHTVIRLLALLFIAAMARSAVAWAMASTTGFCTMRRTFELGAIGDRYTCTGDCSDLCTMYYGTDSPGNHYITCTCPLSDDQSCLAVVFYSVDNSGAILSILEYCQDYNCGGECQTTPPTATSMCNCDGV